MAITMELDFEGFHRAFERMGRGDNFTWHGLRALFEYLEDYADGTGEDYRMDVIALCVEYTEYENESELLSAYDHDEAFGTVEAIRDYTTVLAFETQAGGQGYIVADF